MIIHKCIYSKLDGKYKGSLIEAELDEKREVNDVIFYGANDEGWNENEISLNDIPKERLIELREYIDILIDRKV